MALWGLMGKYTASKRKRQPFAITNFHVKYFTKFLSLMIRFFNGTSEEFRSYWYFQQSGTRLKNLNRLKCWKLLQPKSLSVRFWFIGLILLLIKDSVETHVKLLHFSNFRLRETWWKTKMISKIGKKLFEYDYSVRERF